MIGRNGGAVTIRAQDQDWRLVLDLNALADAEGLLGRSALEVLAEFGERDPTLSEIRILFWAMLQEHHAGVTLRQAGRIAADAPDALRQVLTATLPDAEPGAENPPKAGTAPA
jgi:hypothetical protein